MKHIGLCQIKDNTTANADFSPEPTVQKSNTAVQSGASLAGKGYSQLQESWQPTYESTKLLSNYSHADKPVFARPDNQGSTLELGPGLYLDIGSPR